MIFSKFGADSRQVVVGAREIAVELDAPAVEADHLLLAAARRGSVAGLDYDELRNALDAEFEASLAAVGVALADFDLTASPTPDRSPRWGATATLALKRTAKIADARRDRRITPGHIVLGVLQAPTGTVPRALQRAGVDRAELSDRVAATL